MARTGLFVMLLKPYQLKRVVVCHYVFSLCGGVFFAAISAEITATKPITLNKHACF
ncbi:MAG: hypothetical protein ACPG8W_22380 [Candidatus Promineifilaceae bacterium]